MGAAEGIVKVIELLLGPETPWWLKALIVLALLGTLAAWWTRPYWHDLDRTNAPAAKRQARPPFDL